MFVGTWKDTYVPAWECIVIIVVWLSFIGLMVYVAHKDFPISDRALSIIELVMVMLAGKDFRDRYRRIRMRMVKWSTQSGTSNYSQSQSDSWES